MSTALESLDSALFQPLAATEQELILGGMADRFTPIGLTDAGGAIVVDHVVDRDPAPQPEILLA